MYSYFLYLLYSIFLRNFFTNNHTHRNSFNVFLQATYLFKNVLKTNVEVTIQLVKLEYINLITALAGKKVYFSILKHIIFVASY